MKKATPIIALGLGIVLAQNASASNTVRISQQYGSGGNASAVYNQDYVELFNFSGSPVNIGGWSIQYGAATGTAGFSGGSSPVFVSIPANTIIQPCGYFLISTGTAGATGANLPGVDLVGNTSLNMSGSAGKLALISNQTAPTACSGTSVGGVFVDVLGYGASANCYEGSPAPGTSASTAATRGGGGMNDTDNNSADFTSVAPSPHNSASPKNAQCLATPSSARTWGRLKILYR